MSARVESAPVGRFNVRAIAIAVVVALGIGGLAGLAVTRATEQHATVTTPVGVQSWDVQKLEAMEGRQLAEQVRARAQLVWDAGKLEAMEGRQLAERFRVEPGSVDLWDEGKLEAMEGRQSAEEIRRQRPPGGPLG